jgi:aspartyl-tRNA synthetase
LSLKDERLTNTEMNIGEIKMLVFKLEAISKSEHLSFGLDDSQESNNELLLKYLYLELRMKGTSKKIIFHSKIMKNLY